MSLTPLGRDECRCISVFDPHRIIFFFCTCYHMKALKSTFLCLRGRKISPVKNSVSCCQTWLYLGCRFPSRQSCQPLRFLGRTEAVFHGYRPCRGSHGLCFCPGNLLPKDILNTSLKRYLHVSIFSTFSASENIKHGTPACMWVSRAKTCIV